MDSGEFEAAQRAGESYQDLTVPRGSWPVLRLDGRGFGRLTGERFARPFDERFAGYMTEVARVLLTELGARFAYTQSDEISVLLPRDSGLFGRRQEKLVSVSAGLASAAFTQAAGVFGHFDSRVWLGAGPCAVADYFSWRQADAARNALNAWTYWTLREEGRSSGEATRSLRGVSTRVRQDLLARRGVRFEELPAWQRRGIALWWREVPARGFDPVRAVPVTTTRRRVHVERDLPWKQAYRFLVLGQLA
ncbi:tRNA(His) 5'-end guanylyltransferase [Crossiella equi]|uniref:tRNA(His) guanylyltransferase n=1 Tax=Crossiella equi TaxID=130796 RepID=A0ABS5ANM9_9PSEU|nr:tRNA(His) guanylyltransferase Thg1 family protein [Crossiella equi]MBP2478173.1 tRNA(His) 5'-end guanylyltransferase [Crossiella equi]